MNIYTKVSQWERPTEPIYPQQHGAPPGPPPGYGGHGPPSADVKGNPYDDKPAPSHNIDEDAKFAARLQAEEDERARLSSSRGAQQDYASTPLPQGYGQQSQQAQAQQETRSKGGFLSKLMGKASGSSQPHYQQQQYPQQYQQSYAPQGYGGYPQQSYGGYQTQQYGGYQQQYQQAPKKSGGGLGMAGGAALGLGGGLIGGMLLEDAIQDHDQEEYQQGYGEFPVDHEMKYLQNTC